MDSDDNDLMTPAQRETIQKAYTMLGEQFEHVLIVVDYETSEGGETFNAHEGYWHGGALTAVGLAEFAKHKILKSKKQDSDPNYED